MALGDVLVHHFGLLLLRDKFYLRGGAFFLIYGIFSLDWLFFRLVFLREVIDCGNLLDRGHNLVAVVVELLCRDHCEQKGGT